MDDEDPMAYLNKMKAHMAEMETLASVGDEALQAAINAKESMERIDEMLAESPEKDRSENKPPPGLSPQEEMEWWNNRIAYLSRDITGNSDDKPSAKSVARCGSKKCEDSDDKIVYNSERKYDRSYKK